MRRQRGTRILLGHALIFLAISARPTATVADQGAASDKARTAGAFVDSIGVNIHLGYSDTVYRRYDDVIKPRLIELGVRHIRDGLRLDRNDVIAKLNDLATHGIRSDLLLRPDEAVAIAKAAAASVLTIEGPNEPDHGDAWRAAARERQAALFRAVKGDPATAGIPILVSGMANTRDGPGRLGMLVDVLDYGNVHSYPGGRNPTSGGWGIALERAFAEERKVCGDRPIVATETGYHNREAEAGHPGVSETAAAKYLPRLLLTYFDAGIVRTYLYEFADERPDPGMADKEQHFGLIRVDGTPKPAFVAIKNLIALLRDPGPPFEPGPLDYTLEGGRGDVRHLLLRSRDGTLHLVVWQEVASFDLKNKHDLVIPSQDVTLRLPAHAARATLFRPVASVEPVAQFEDPRAIRLQVPDEPLIIRILLRPR